LKNSNQSKETAMTDIDILKDGDRVSHQTKGLGTVKLETHDVVVSETAAPETSETVHVIWDDDRFPVGNVPRNELEKVPDAAIAISTGV
jgi:hypothetical protein